MFVGKREIKSHDSSVLGEWEVIALINHTLPVLTLSKIILHLINLWKQQGGRNKRISLPETVIKSNICMYGEMYTSQRIHCNTK